MAIEVNTKALQQGGLLKLIKHVLERRERVVLVRFDRRVAALVPISDFDLLERNSFTVATRDPDSLAELFLCGGTK